MAEDFPELMRQNSSDPRSNLDPRKIIKVNTLRWIKITKVREDYKSKQWEKNIKLQGTIIATQTSRMILPEF